VSRRGDDHALIPITLESRKRYCSSRFAQLEAMRPYGECGRLLHAPVAAITMRTAKRIERANPRKVPLTTERHIGPFPG